MLELLIVIAIMAVLAAVAIFVLNPAETLREARDAQRISDLATIKTALALYITKTTSTVYLGNSGSNDSCKTGSSWATGDKINYSSETAITDITLDGGTTFPTSTISATPTLTDGTGWIPVNLSGLIGGSPISNMPQDPTNVITNTASVAGTDLVYRYACGDDATFEIDAQFESISFATKKSKDGGNNANLYEVGIKLSILGAGSDF